MSPARAIKVRPGPNWAVMACSHATFASPYRSMLCITSDASGGRSAADSSWSNSRWLAYTLVLETKTYRPTTGSSAATAPRTCPGCLATSTTASH